MRYLTLVVTSVAIFIIIWIDFRVFPFIQCDCNAEKINSIISNLALATIASFIFYFINVYLTEVKEKNSAKEHIHINIDKIISLSLGLKASIEISSDQKFNNYYPTKEELINALIKIPLNSIHDNDRVANVTWEQYFKELSQDSRYLINRIFTISNLLDIRLLLHLNKLYDCSFFDFAEEIAPISVIQQKIKWIDLNNCCSYHYSILSYYLLIKELDELKKAGNTV